MENTLAFLEVVRQFIGVDDFNQNFIKIGELNQLYRDSFILCIKIGCKLEDTFEASEILFNLSIDTPMTINNIVSIIPEFRELDKLINP